MAEEKIGDLYFDVLLKDRTAEGIAKIKKSVNDQLNTEVKSKTFDAAAEAQKKLNAALEKSKLLREAEYKAAVKQEEQNKKIERTMRDAAKAQNALGNAVIPSQSYDALVAKLKELNNQYNALSKRKREGAQGASLLGEMSNLQHQIAQIDQIRNSMKRVATLQAQLNDLQGNVRRGGYEKQAIILQQQVELERQYIALKEKERLINQNGGQNKSKELIETQQAIKYTEQLVQVEYELRNLRASGANAVKDLYNKQTELDLEKTKLNLLQQEKQLQLQIDFERRNGATLASKQAELDIEKRKNMLIAENMRLEYERNIFNSATATRNRQLQAELSLLKQKANLQRQLAYITGNDAMARAYQNNANLKQEVAMRQELLRLKKEAAFYQTKEGKELLKLRQAVKDIRNEYEATNREARKHGIVMDSLVNMARNYVGVFGAVSLVRSLYRIRGEFEMQEVALKSIMQSTAQATELYGKLQSLAIESPFRFQDVLGFSKQLSAFQIPNRELFDTTKRLADLSAGLGVDMSRIILAYGQVRSASVLRGQELRQFTEAGIPMVQALADKFSLLEGRVVSTGEVFDKISKRAVSFEMVKEVIEDLTDEGGRFYNHQLKQSETLYGKVQKLGDAWQIMLNNIGKANSDILKAPLDMMLGVMTNWRTTLTMLVDVMAYFSAKSFLKSTMFTSMATGLSSLAKQLKTFGLVGWFQNARVQASLFNMQIKQTGGYIKNIGVAMKSLMASQAFWTAIVVVVTDIISSWYQAKQAVDDFNESLRDGFKYTASELEQFNRSYAETINKIRNSKVDEPILSVEESEKAWEALKGQIEKMANSDANISGLMAIDDIGERNRAAVKLLDTLGGVNDVLAEMGDTLAYTQDVWHGIFGEGLNSDASDLSKKLKSITNNFDPSLKSRIGDNEFSKYVESMKNASSTEMHEFIAEVTKTAQQSLVPMLQELVKKGFGDEQSINYAIKSWENKIIEANPSISGEVRAIFENGINDFLTKNNFDFMQSVNLDESEETLNQFYRRMSKTAKDHNIDLNDAIQKQDQETIKKVAELTMKENVSLVDVLYMDFWKLCQNISALTPRLMVKIGVQTEGEAQKYFKGLGMDVSNIPSDLNLKDSPKHFKEEYKAAKEEEQSAKDRNKALKAQLAQGKITQKAYEAQKKQNDIIIIQKQALQKQSEEFYNSVATGSVAYDEKAAKKAATASRKAESKANKREKERIKGIQDRYALVEKGIKEFERLKDKIGEQNALEQLMAMEEFKNLTGENGESLIKKYANNAPALRDKIIAELLNGKKQEDSSEKAKEAVIAEAKKKADDIVNQIIKDLDNAAKKLKNYIDVSAKNWNLYDRFFKITGDENSSSSIAFGGKKMFDTFEAELTDMLEKELKKDGVEISVEDLIKLNGYEDIANLSDVSKTIINQIKSLRDASKSEFLNILAEAMEKYMTTEEKVSVLRNQMGEYLWDMMNEGFTPYSKEYQSALKLWQDRITEIESEGIRLSEWWTTLFDSMAVETFSGLTKTVKRYEDAFKNATKSGNMYKVKDPNTGETKEMTEKDFREAKKQVDALVKKLRDKSITKYMKDLFDGFKTKDVVDKFDTIVAAVGRTNEELKKATGPAKEFFASIGNEAIGDAIDLFHEEMEALEQVGEALTQMASGDYLGGAINAIGGMFKSIVAFFNFHDKRLDRIIAESQLQVTKLQNAYDMLSKEIERTLGGAYRRSYGNVYKDQLKNLQEQQKELQRQRDAEASKKKKDKSALADYDKQLQDIYDTIKHFAEDTLKELLNVDLKSWADQLSSSIVDAFAAGEDAAKAFDKTVAEIIKGMITDMASLYILQPIMDNVRTYLFGTDGKSGVFGSDLKLTENEIPGLINMLMGVKDGISAIGDLWDTIDEAYKASTGKSLSDTLGGKGGNTIGQGIQAVTEDTANLLASYINAIRADVSVIRMLTQMQSDALTNPIAQAQITSLNAIATNTLRNAEAAERIESTLRSVVTVGSTGSKIRV